MEMTRMKLEEQDFSVLTSGRGAERAIPDVANRQKNSCIAQES